MMRSMQPYFPRFLPDEVVRMLDMRRQLRSYETLPLQEQRRIQSRQLATLLRHAETHSPFWRKRIGQAKSKRSDGSVSLADMEPLTRSDLQDHFDAMRAHPESPKPLATTVASTSGSTGRPVRVEKLSRLHGALYEAIGLIDHEWHQRDLNSSLAVIKDVPDGGQAGWSPKFRALGFAGQAHTRNMISHSADSLFAWLTEIRPAYLTTTPMMAKRLAEIALEDADGGPPIRQIITFGETVTDEMRDLCRAAFQARITDRYSSEEVGWIALQCPKHDHFHAMSATVMTEIVDDAGRPCLPGEAGRVLLTALHSYAMPIVRYEIGDYAERGGPCNCGISLPVIKRILGRERSFIRLPDGTLRLARLTGEYWRDVAPVREYRLVQYADGLIEAFVVCARPLEETERRAARSMLQKALGHPLEVIVTEVPAIDWGSRTKKLDVVRLDRNRGEPG